ncbi:YdcF family protein [Pyruvatibacter mobilis]|uniref:YdcF family protein n=1 Tax=Pyruvatibacter mobilis TaxID=1712261 RepID=A0A845Q783_9HYPH|nr:YdcF family protein [Pyruvatibacter mobilis]NBG94442.1 YdcF family protein [Pyruvatibacter mobilis]QJD73966.1 YdcF family protein [Pyruvatibacter mobilis]
MNSSIPIFRHKKPRRGGLSVLARVGMGFALVLVLMAGGGFLSFLAAIPEPQQPLDPSSAPSADGIVVLTGGRDRIAVAMQLLEAGRGARLLISGVNEEITREDLAASFGGDGTRFGCCVDLGFAARTTVGNAEETADWVAEQGFRSLVVVTSDYHMPRSLALLRHRMPAVSFAPYAVAMDGPSTNRALRNVKLARILVTEYAKYVVTLVHHRLG